jgi:hypothetical protein
MLSAVAAWPVEPAALERHRQVVGAKTRLVQQW